MANVSGLDQIADNQTPEGICEESVAEINVRTPASNATIYPVMATGTGWGKGRGVTKLLCRERFRQSSTPCDSESPESGQQYCEEDGTTLDSGHRGTRSQ